MPQDPLPSSASDGEEAGGPVLPPTGGTGPGADHRPDDDGDIGAGPEQGLFVCLPAEDLDVARFCQHGESDVMPPGPLLAEVVHALAGEDGGGLAALSDDQLMGIIAATRRLEARVAWTQLAAIAEFAARRRPAQQDRDGFAADELACGLNLTWQSAAGQIDYATAVAERLPCTFAALAEGRLHPVHARIIEDETSILGDQDTAAADEELAVKAGSLTFGQLRALAHRLVLKLDPEAARKRKEAARRQAQVRRFREASGNAGMVARELPPDEVLASWQHVEQRARELRAAGLGLLDARDARALVAAAARHPDTRWCLTAVAPDGTAAAHGCAAGPLRWPAGPLRWPAGPQAAQVLRALKVTFRPVIRGPCDHAQAEHRYRPSRVLRHLVGARNTRCTAPGCGRPAARCDLDHTRPWHQGGITCPCDLAPLCRHHHRCKQAGGWWLEQPEPGVLVWRTPAGRTYTTTPTEYPV